MGEATSRSGALCATVEELVAVLAEGQSIVDLKAKLRMIGETFNVVCVQIATTIVAAMPTRETISAKHVVPPPFVRLRKSLVPALGDLPVLVGVAGRSAGSAFPGALTDKSAGLSRVGNPFAGPNEPGNGLTSCPSGTHFGSSLVAHLRTFGGHVAHDRERV